MFKLFDTYSGVPELIGTFRTFDEAQAAARERECDARGKFYPLLLCGNTIVAPRSY